MRTHGRGTPIRRAAIALALLAALAPAAAVLASGGAGATGYVATRDCQEHQAFIQGDPKAVAARLPKRYHALDDPATGAPVLFVRALHCAGLTVGGVRTGPVTEASYGIVVQSPDGSGCASGAPGVGSQAGDEPPLCNWYALAWVANDRRVTRWLRRGTRHFPARTVPGLRFELGQFDAAKGGAPLHVSAPAPSPSRFTMDEVGRPRPGTLSVRGSYWNDTPRGTVRVRFSSDVLRSGDASGTVRAAPGSELAKLMGAPERPYLAGPYGAVGAEHWDDASYRKQLERANDRGDGFAGSCSVKGTVHFRPPAKTADADLTYDYSARGTCTGTLDRRKLTNAPVRLHQAGPAHGGCVRAHTSAPGRGSMRFAHGVRVDYTLDFSFVGTDGDLTVYGTRAGSASGHGSFVTDRTPPAGAGACGGTGVRQVPMDWSFKTASPLIDAPPALHVSVRPRHVRAGRRARMRVLVTHAGGLPVRGASIRLPGRRTWTGRRGGAAFVATFWHPGRVRVRVTKSGYRAARAAIVVRRAHDGRD